MIAILPTTKPKLLVTFKGEDQIKHGRKFIYCRNKGDLRNQRYARQGWKMPLRAWRASATRPRARWPPTASG
jgi:hypothetical protein